MNSQKIAEILGKYPTGNLCNANPTVKAMNANLAPLYKGISFCGPAKTARITPGQNAAIHRAVHNAKSGDVIVVAAAGETGFGPFGDILATCCQNQGVVGLVIDGTIRDTAEITELMFPVFCLGANPTATGKVDLGEIDTEIECAGLRVRPGDFIVGDDDGVVVIPIETVEELANAVGKTAQKEEIILARLARGETTLEIFGIEL